MTDWLPHSKEFLNRSDYCQAAKVYSEAIIAEPSIRSHYCYLGLLQLLQEQEIEAQNTWFGWGEDSTSAEFFVYTNELCKVLLKEANRQEELKEYKYALLIRQHLCQIQPTNLDNLVQIVYLSLQLGTLTSNSLLDLKIIQSLESSMVLEDKSILQLIQNILYSDLPEDIRLDFTSSCLPFVRDKEDSMNLLLMFANKAFMQSLDKGLRVIDLCLKLNPNDIKPFISLVNFLLYNRHYADGLAAARKSIPLAKNLFEQIVAIFLLLSALMSAGGNWHEASSVFNDLKSLMTKLIAEKPSFIPSYYASYFCLSYFFAAYLKDLPRTNHLAQNQLLSFCQYHFKHQYSETFHRYQKRHSTKKSETPPLKIGYLSSSLKSHSVGWLARWLFHYHDRNRFQIYGYFPKYVQGKDLLQEWYISQFTKAYKQEVNYGETSLDIANEIFADGIDILVDLDSITESICCDVMALKPAPVQLTWLGFDASGLPTIDYFIADPYVLPENAQDYYSEKIWRLPQTYIAVDGFETVVPTLRRDHLEIPEQAIVYISAQSGYKRNPDTSRLQIQIIKQVPDSYFLIKGSADEETIKEFFYNLAECEGVEINRLKFLPSVKSEAEHRANLSIADVVLDTYPYNGATTTLETLWMAIPIVTRVGEQFSARNSYTMMMNAGITEGISWSDEEYINWGIRFGKDESLRQQVAWKLKESRKTSPLWNGRQFTKEMEKAYTEMWDIYLQET